MLLVIYLIFNIEKPGKLCVVFVLIWGMNDILAQKFHCENKPGAKSEINV